MTTNEAVKMLAKKLGTTGLPSHEEQQIIGDLEMPDMSEAEWLAYWEMRVSDRKELLDSKRRSREFDR